MMTKLLLLGIFSENKIGRIFNTTQLKLKGVIARKCYGQMGVRIVESITLSLG
jgi:hypothetical protein